MKVHPIADMLPMLSEDELADLAADIKEHGQQLEIVVTDIDDEEVLLDGRNRLRACEIAGVNPKIRKLNGEDPVAFIIAANMRRDITKGQRAIWAAQAAPYTEQGKRADLTCPETDKSRFPMVSKQRLSEARIINQFAPDLAEQIIKNKGDVSFAEAFAKARQRKVEKEDNEKLMAELRQEAPDLADLSGISLKEATDRLKRRREEEELLRTIDDEKLVGLVREGRMSVSEAIVVQADREAKKQAAQSGSTMLLARVVALLGVGLDPKQSAADLMQNVNLKMWPQEQDDVTSAHLKACADWFAECARILKSREK